MHSTYKKWIHCTALSTTIITGMTTTLAQPFFPEYAAQHFNVSASTVGVVSAGCPAAQVLSTPLWTFLMGKLGRKITLLLGCLVLSVGTIAFAFSTSVAGFLLGRILQGVGSQGANASSIALIMEVSERLQADMGVIEFVWGLGYMIGPPIGGVAFHFAGFSLAHMPAASLSMLLAANCLALIYGADANNRGQYTLVPQEDSLEDDVPERHEHCSDIEEEIDAEITRANKTIQDTDTSELHNAAEHGKAGRTRACAWRRLCTFSVFAVGLGIVGHAAAQGFKEISLAKHLHLSLKTDPAGSGLVFMLESLVYCVVCIAVGRLLTQEGQQACTILIGLSLYGLGLYCLAVPDFFTSDDNSGEAGGARGPQAGVLRGISFFLTTRGEWVVVLASLSLMGASSACILVPSCPYMLLSCKAHTHTHTQSLDSSSATPDNQSQTSGGNGDMSSSRAPTRLSPSSTVQSRPLHRSSGGGDEMVGSSLGGACARMGGSDGRDSVQGGTEGGVERWEDEERELEDEERELEDAMSGLYPCIWSVGELLGPPLGGWLLDTLPTTLELNCISPFNTSAHTYQDYSLNASRPGGAQRGAARHAGSGGADIVAVTVPPDPQHLASKEGNGGDADANDCVWAFHNTMLVFAFMMLVCTGIMCMDVLRGYMRRRRLRAALPPPLFRPPSQPVQEEDVRRDAHAHTAQSTPHVGADLVGFAHASVSITLAPATAVHYHITLAPSTAVHYHQRFEDGGG